MIDKTQVPTFVINCSTLLNAYEVRALERQLIKEHIEAHGQKPVGNVKDEEHMDRKVNVRDTLWADLFE